MIFFRIEKEKAIFGNFLMDKFAIRFIFQTSKLARGNEKKVETESEAFVRWRDVAKLKLD